MEKKVEKQKGLRKRKAPEKVSENQSVERWNDDETEQLLIYLEENYKQYQHGKKSEFYDIVSSKIVILKSAESIKGRLRRLLDKYNQVKQLNNQTGSGRVNWKWLEKMESIFGCRKNISPSFVSNISTDYLSDEEKEVKIEKKDKKVVKKKKNNVESLIEIMGSISQTKIKMSEQKLELEKEKMEHDHKLQMEKLEIEKQKWEYEREQSRMLHELTMKKLELQFKQYNN